MTLLCKTKLDDQINFFYKKKYIIPIYSDILESEECISHSKSFVWYYDNSCFLKDVD